MACVLLSLEKVTRPPEDRRSCLIRGSLRRREGAVMMSWVASDETMSTSIVELLERVKSVVCRSALSMTSLYPSTSISVAPNQLRFEATKLAFAPIWRRSSCWVATRRRRERKSLTARGKVGEFEPTSEWGSGGRGLKVVDEEGWDGGAGRRASISRSRPVLPCSTRSQTPSALKPTTGKLRQSRDKL